MRAEQQRLTQQASFLAIRLALPTSAGASHFVAASGALCGLLRELAEFFAVRLILLLASGCGSREPWSCMVIRDKPLK